MSRINEIRERWSKVRFECDAADENAYADDVGYLLSLVKDGGVEERQLIQDLAHSRSMY